MRLPVRRDLEPGALEPLELGRVRRQVEALGGAEPVAPDRQWPRRGYLWVELADRARGGVAWVGEGWLPGLGALLVQPGERRAREIDLTAHLHQRRRILDPERDGVDGPQVRRDLLPHLAVPAGRSARELTALVDERDGEAVDLRLADVFDLLHLGAGGGGQPANADVPGAQLLLVARIGQREHRLEVADLLELLERLRPHALGGRVRGAQLGVRGLQIPQLVEELVVLGVRDLGVVEYVVAVVVVLDQAAQLGRPLLRRRPTQPLAPRVAGAGRGRNPRAPRLRRCRSGRSGSG